MTTIIKIKQSKAKIFAWSIGLFLLSALIASAVSCFARETFHIICFAEKFAYFAGIQIFLYIPFLIIVIFYENQFIQISKEGLRFRRRLGFVRDIEFDHITGVTNTTRGLVVAVRGKPNVKMDAWRYKKSDMERVKTLLDGAATRQIRVLPHNLQASRYPGGRESRDDQIGDYRHEFHRASPS